MNSKVIKHDCKKEIVCKILPMVGYFVRCRVCNISASHRVKSKAYAEFMDRINDK